MNRDSLLLWTHNKPTDRPHAHTCVSVCAHTLSSSSLLALQAVSHPSIHVTERWVHPVTGQLVAVTLIYVAPLSSLFLLWWRDYVCSLPIRKVYSDRNGGAGVGAQSDRSREKSPCVSKLYDGFLPGQHHFITAFAPLSSKPGCIGLLSCCYSYTSQVTVEKYQEWDGKHCSIHVCWNVKRLCAVVTKQTLFTHKPLSCRHLLFFQMKLNI